MAIKRVVFDGAEGARRVLREIGTLRVLKHPDLVEMKRVMLPRDMASFKELFIVFELMDADLGTVLLANPDLTHEHKRVFLYQMLRGLDFVHRAGVFHRDIKPANVLVNTDCKVKLCDFGLARRRVADADICPSEAAWTDYVASRWYRAPELCFCSGGAYTQAVDIWAVGCIFGEMLLKRPLFPGSDDVNVCHQVNVVPCSKD